MPKAVDVAGKGDAPPAVPKQSKSYRNGHDAPVEEASA
jgi:hypothetical protein